MAADSDFEIRFTNREVTAWGGLALLKRMLDVIGFRSAAQSWDLPQPGSNRGYPPIQIIEQFIVSIWCGANRFAHAEITRFDRTLTRLFEWKQVAGHKAIVRLFAKFDMARNEHVQAEIYRWIFDHIRLSRVTLDLDSTVITRYGTPEGGAKGYNATKPGRLSHPPAARIRSRMPHGGQFLVTSRQQQQCQQHPAISGINHAPSGKQDHWIVACRQRVLR